MENRYEIFTNLILKINRIIKRIKTEEMELYNLKSQHVSCLYYLYVNNEDITATMLTEISGEDKATISRALEFLENESYIICESKTEKKYRSLLQLTDKGREIGSKVANRVQSIVESAGDELDSESREVMYKSLNKICENLEKISENYGDDKND